MASGLLFLSDRGQTIIARDYRGEVKLHDVPARFTELVISNVENAGSPLAAPVMSDDGVTYCWIKQNDIYAVAVSRLNVNVTANLVFLRRVCELFQQLYHKLDEETLQDRFLSVYEVLDEVIDNGYPQLTEPKVLKRIVGGSGTAMASVTPSAVSWRAENIRHSKNEVFLDVVEKVDCLVSSNNKVLSCDIIGCLRMKSNLSGMPELKLGLNDRQMLETTSVSSMNRLEPSTVDLQNIRFHQCVRLNIFERERIISFIPPDGEFELMSYTVAKTPTATALASHNTVDETILPFWLEVALGPSHLDPDATRVEYFVKLKSSFKPKIVATKVEVRIPVPKEANNPTFKCSSGEVKYKPECLAFVWTLKHVPGQKEQILTASISRTVSSSDFWFRKPAEVIFEIPFFTTSKINVRYLKIFEASGYQALPWVRYITQNGNYQFRMT